MSDVPNLFPLLSSERFLVNKAEIGRRFDVDREEVQVENSGHPLAPAKPLVPRGCEVLYATFGHLNVVDGYLNPVEGLLIALISGSGKQSSNPHNELAELV